MPGLQRSTNTVEVLHWRDTHPYSVQGVNLGPRRNPKTSLLLGVEDSRDWLVTTTCPFTPPPISFSLRCLRGGRNHQWKFSIGRSSYTFTPRAVPSRYALGKVACHSTTTSDWDESGSWSRWLNQVLFLAQAARSKKWSWTFPLRPLLVRKQFCMTVQGTFNLQAGSFHNITPRGLWHVCGPRRLLTLCFRPSVWFGS